MIKKFIFPLILICAIACCLFGCSDGKDNSDKNANTPPPVTDEQLTEEEREIKSAFAAKHNVPFDTVHYTSYGEYNGAHALMITADDIGYGAVITYDIVGGITLTYSDSHTMDVYYEGEFYSLSVAYETGLLTKDDLIEIAKRFGGYYLTEQEEAGIIAAYRENNADVITDDAEVIISSHYGSVGGYCAVSVGVKGTIPYLGKTEEITADGELFGEEYHAVVKIRYVNNFGISLYKEGSLCTLKYAVENKLISLDDFIELSERNTFYFVS